MQTLSRGIGELDQAVELGPGIAGDGAVGLGFFPIVLPFLFNGRKIVIHDCFSFVSSIKFFITKAPDLRRGQGRKCAVPPCVWPLVAAAALTSPSPSKGFAGNGARPSRPVQAESSGASITERSRRLTPHRRLS